MQELMTLWRRSDTYGGMRSLMDMNVDLKSNRGAKCGVFVVSNITHRGRRKHTGERMSHLC